MRQSELKIEKKKIPSKDVIKTKKGEGGLVGVQEPD